MEAVETRDMGNKILVRDDEVTALVVRSLVEREGKRLKFAEYRNASKDRRKFLEDVCNGNREAGEIDKVMSAHVLMLAAHFHETRLPGDRARCFVAACELARFALTKKRESMDGIPDTLRQVAAALAPVSPP
jgi:hypothetical protein